MDMEHINPILQRASEGRALTPVSTSSGEQGKRRTRPNVHPTTARLIGEMGIRFRPSAQADLEAHAEALRFLAEDVSDIPPPLLEKACRAWARDSRFMPKASELIALAEKIASEEIRGTDAAGQQLQDHCDRLNAMKGDKHWFVAGQKPARYVSNQPRMMR